VVRLRSLALIFCAGLTACQPAENAVLIEVHTQAGISRMRVIVLSLDGPETWTDPYETINMTAEEINADPLHVVVELGAPQRILVQVEGYGMDGSTRLVATRCYTVDGVVRDEVQLVVVGGDIDMDGFVVDPATVCREPVMGGGERTCDPMLDHVCPDDRAADCDDSPGTGAMIYPGAGIVCLDGIDQDCDGDIEEQCADLDGDGHNSCPMNPMGPCDCNDNVPSINPDAPDICNDGIDQDCSARGDPRGDACCDSDNDMWCTCTTGELLPPCLGLDCNDDNADANPSVAEVCDGIDNDCDRIADELDECRGPDLDGDGVADCGRENPGDPCDCNDCDAAIYPGARELCYPRVDGAMGNSIDEDCDGTPDNGCPANDNDGDGYGPNDCRDDDRFAFPHQNNEVQVDRCGDGQASTCIPGDPDTSCADDADGDGFTEPSECENNPAIRPDADEVCNGIDDDCDGVTDEVLDVTNLSGCGLGSPIDFVTSFTDCGSCRSVCSDARANACEGGTCVCTNDPARTECAAGTNCCSVGCVDLQTDATHCGLCERRCGLNEVCTTGECRCGTGPACGADETCCNGACVDTRTDVTNCGMCNTICGANASCNSGSCACADTSTENWDDCDGDLGMNGNGCESNLNVDEAHCGRCNDACSALNGTPTCTGGNCTIACNAGYGDCDGNTRGTGCENELNTLADCGTCGMSCAIGNATATCGTDACRVQSCNSGWGDCNMDFTSCETRLNTPSNCGACNAQCNVTGGTPDCADGTCGVNCNAGLGDCDGNQVSCEQMLNTNMHCGQCNRPCTAMNATPTCATGSCRVASCNSGFGDCNMDNTSCETALTSNTHCGACNTPCAITNAVATCSTGACRVSSCLTGHGDCDMDRLSCETPLNTLADCGSCGTDCDIPNATETCATGACRVVACAPGFADCTIPIDGTNCGQQLNTLQHCGACNNPCGDANGTESCATGTCVITCNPGFSDCDMDGDCDSLSTTTHCGACGDNCTGTTPGCCGGTNCVDFATDENNCGSCGRTCAMGSMCMGGQCRCGSVSGQCLSPMVCCDPPGGGSELACVANSDAC
jgi:hypothetical protein